MKKKTKKKTAKLIKHARTHATMTLDKQSKAETGINVVLLHKERPGEVCACSNTLWNDEN